VRANRVRDYVIYISIGLGLVVFIYWHAGRGPALSESDKNWMGLAFFTPTLFGYAVANYRRDWKRPRFWGIVLALLAVHLGAFSAIFATVNHFGALWYALAFPTETAGIDVVLRKAGHKSHNNHQ
jgi:hypothetical protein